MHTRICQSICQTPTDLIFKKINCTNNQTVQEVFDRFRLSPLSKNWWTQDTRTLLVVEADTDMAGLLKLRFRHRMITTMRTSPKVCKWNSKQRVIALRRHSLSDRSQGARISRAPTVSSVKWFLTLVLNGISFVERSSVTKTPPTILRVFKHKLHMQRYKYNL